MLSVIRSNANAAVSAVGTAAAGLVVYLLSRYASIHLSSAYQLLLAGAVSSGLLFLGKNGAVGTWNTVKKLILHGRGTPPAPPSSSGTP